MNHLDTYSARIALEKAGLKPKKKFGQNFLLNETVTDQIAGLAGNISEHHVIEIGPGPGGLTKSILKRTPLTLTAVEFDLHAVDMLGDLKSASNNKLRLIQEDALNIDLPARIKGPRIIIANLPYNIATPLLIKWLHEIYHDSNTYSRMILMFQKEVANRIVAHPNSKNYGRLSILSQWLTTPRIVKTLAPGNFTPPPKVDSAIVDFKPCTHSKPKVDISILEAVVKQAFSQRRKQIKSTLKEYTGCLESLNIDLTHRPENLSVQNYVDLAVKIKA